MRVIVGRVKSLGSATKIPPKKKARELRQMGRKSAGERRINRGTKALGRLGCRTREEIHRSFHPKNIDN
jgi:hypothetical protein